MNNAFPSVSTVLLEDATAGSIIKIARSDGAKLALVTDHFVNGTRSFVWLNPNFRDRPAVIFAQNWRNDPSVLQYLSNTRFDLGSANEELDPSGRNYWQTPGVIVSIGDQLFIRAAPQDDDFYGGTKLVNIRNGSVYSDRPPDTLWAIVGERPTQGRRLYANPVTCSQDGIGHRIGGAA